MIQALAKISSNKAELNLPVFGAEKSHFRSNITTLAI